MWHLIWVYTVYGFPGKNGLMVLQSCIISSTMQSTDRGKKINAAVSQTGKYVVQTGKAVGKNSRVVSKRSWKMIIESF